jgi:protein phosphatase
LRRHNKRLPDELKMLDNRNIITRSLGPEATVEIDMEGPHPILPGDVYVVCSDGLSSQVSDEEIGAVARELSPTQACRLLVHLANLRGGADNCTVVTVRIGDLPANVEAEPPPPPEPEPAPNPFGWEWLVGFWLVAMALVGGLSLLLFGRVPQGAVVTTVGAVGLIAMGTAAWRRYRAARPHGGDGQTVYSRPHRTAVAKSSQALVETLSGVERDLRRAAQEEEWNVEWEAHQQALSSAAEAVQQKRYARAVRDFARALDVLMSDLPKRRAAAASALANAAAGER